MTDEEKQKYWVGLLEDQQDKSKNLFENSDAIAEHEKAVQESNQVEESEKETDDNTKSE